VLNEAFDKNRDKKLRVGSFPYFQVRWGKN